MIGTTYLISQLVPVLFFGYESSIWPTLNVHSLIKKRAMTEMNILTNRKINSKSLMKLKGMTYRMIPKNAVIVDAPA